MTVVNNHINFNIFVGRFVKCNTRFCGPLLTREVKLKSGGRDVSAETRHCSSIQQAGEERAAQVQPGTMVGSECTNETEPYIVSIALTAQMVWEGPDDTSWMGTITEGCRIELCKYLIDFDYSVVCVLTMLTGDKYIRAKKLIRGATDLMYVTSEREYNLHSGDVRVINMKHKEVEVRKSSRKAVVLCSVGKKTYSFDEKEINTLMTLCWQPLK